ncbi:MAG: hypothetical protein MUF51_11765 [Vicinamibacteria bacterium]|nr:hypothetical protein [Vicinamibacteria bacterium]
MQEARTLIEEKEQRLVMRIKAAIREYYYTKSDSAKQEFEEANSLFPFLFSRAWTELKKERESRPEVPATAPPVLAPLAPVVVESEVDAEMESFDIIYPLDPDLRERVIEIERVIGGLSDGIRILKAKGTADDILLQTCRKLVQRAKQTLERGEPSDFTTRRLDLTRQSLITTWKQVQSRLRSSQSLPR